MVVAGPSRPLDVAPQPQIRQRLLLVGKDLLVAAECAELAHELLGALVVLRAHLHRNQFPELVAPSGLTLRLVAQLLHTLEPAAARRPGRLETLRARGEGDDALEFHGFQGTLHTADQGVDRLVDARVGAAAAAVLDTDEPLRTALRTALAAVPAALGAEADRQGIDRVAPLAAPGGLGSRLLDARP